MRLLRILTGAVFIAVGCLAIVGGAGTENLAWLAAIATFAAGFIGLLSAVGPSANDEFD